jgi:RNA polymerase sigma factor (sigma-70 family)
MSELEVLATQFVANRDRLRCVAYRMLGSLSDADDAVQEAWLRLSRPGGEIVENLGGWLTTVVARISLDMLRARKIRDEKPMPADGEGDAAYPSSEEEILLADSVGLALLVVLEKLTPAERIAFVLHDLFELSFDEISPIVNRTATATRQLASRARRRVRGVPEVSDTDLSRQRTVVDTFLSASRGGDLGALLAVLDPDVVFRADPSAVQAGGMPELKGAAAVAKAFSGRAQAARPALINGTVGAVVAPGGHLFLFLTVMIREGRIVEITATRDSAALRLADIAVLAD